MFLRIQDHAVYCSCFCKCEIVLHFRVSSKRFILFRISPEVAKMYKNNCDHFLGAGGASFSIGVTLETIPAAMVLPPSLSANLKPICSSIKFHKETDITNTWSDRKREMKFEVSSHVVTRHAQFISTLEGNLSGNICRSQVELGSVTIREGLSSSTLLLGQDV